MAYFAVVFRPVRNMWVMYNAAVDPAAPVQVPVWVYLAMFANAMIWCIYGFVIGETIVFVQNGICLLMASASLGLLYAMMRKDGSKVELKPSSKLVEETMWMAVVGWVVVTLIMGAMAYNGIILPSTIGLVGVLLALAQFAAPLVVLKQVLSQGFVGGLLDLPLAFLMFVMGFLWTLYGNTLHDPYIIVPNFIGATLSAIQMFILCITPPTRDGWASSSCQSGACCHKDTSAVPALPPKMEI